MHTAVDRKSFKGMPGKKTTLEIKYGAPESQMEQFLFKFFAKSRNMVR